MIYILYSDKICEYQAICSLKSLESKINDDVKVVYFTIDFDSDFDFKNLIKIKIDKNLVYPNLNYYKAELCLKTIELFPEETHFVYGDTDILYSNRLNLDKIKHDNPFPLASCGPHEYPLIYNIVNDKWIIYNEVEMMKYFNVEKRTMWYLFSCFFTFNRNCIDFLEEWMSICQNKFLLKQEQIYFPFKDETPFNICLWKRSVTHNLGFAFVNTHRAEIVDLVENNDVTEEYGTYTDKVNAKWEYIKNSKDVIFYHGFKEKQYLDDALNVLLKKKL